MRRRKPLRERRKSKLKNKLTYGIVAVSLIFVCFLVYSSLHAKNPSLDGQVGFPKAALIDHLGFSSPPRNDFEQAQWETFKNQCRTIVEGVGFNYTYHEGKEVTVDFYRNLPAYDYSLIILRVHSAVIKGPEGKPTELIGLFTSEIWDDVRASEFPEGTLAQSSFPDKEGVYFGITSLFVQSVMDGDFENTVIIMIGCEGLNKASMADAFVHWKRASVYISWTGPVAIDHTDDATIHLLQSLLQQNQTIKTAVELIDPDPTYKSELDYYPNEGDEDVGDNVIQDFISGLTLGITEMGLIVTKFVFSVPQIVLKQ